MRSLSLNFRAAINAQESGEIPLFLVTISHPSMTDAPMRLSTDPTIRISDVPLVYGTLSRGQTHIFLPMEVVLPDEQEGSAPRSQFRLSNVTRKMVELTRSVSTPAKAKLELVFASAPDDVEVESPWLNVLSAKTDSAELTLELSLNAMTAELYPAGSFDPAGFPSLFG